MVKPKENAAKNAREVVYASFVKFRRILDYQDLAFPIVNESALSTSARKSGGNMLRAPEPKRRKL